MNRPPRQHSGLYPGIQQGDNGQSLVFGGARRDGSDGVNALTHMALSVARGVAMIDPEINLRISGNTSLELLELAAMTEPVVGSTAEGRKAGGFFSSSLAPSPGVLVRGPFRVLQSFGKINYQRI